MRFSLAAIAGALLTVAPALVHAQDQPQGQGPMIMVGMNGTLTFTPSSINVPVGTNVTFIFMSKNHSIAQSSFTDPCTTIPNGFQADYFPINNDTTNFPTVTMAVTQTAPIWIYCPQTVPAVHCKAGMVAAINPPPDKTIDTFQAIAKGEIAAPPAANSSASAPSSSDAPGATTGTGGSIVPGNTGGPSTAAPPATPPASSGAPVVSPGSGSGAGNSTGTGKSAALPRVQVALPAVAVGLLSVVAALL